jgi:hypothetical protein
MEAAKEKSKLETASRELHSEMKPAMGNQSSESTTLAADQAHVTRKISALDKMKDLPADKLHGQNEEFNQQIKSAIRHSRKCSPQEF